MRWCHWLAVVCHHQVVDMYKSQELAEDSTKAGDDKDNDDDDGYL